MALAGCGAGSNAPKPPAAPATIHLTSSAFAAGAIIPKRYTCDGPGGPPPLRWTGTPQKTRSLELFVQDPDAPGGTFQHWHLRNIPPSTHRLTGGPGWRPPCPPRGDQPHRYMFTLVAKDASGKALGRGELTGRYARR